MRRKPIDLRPFRVTIAIMANECSCFFCHCSDPDKVVLSMDDIKTVHRNGMVTLKRGVFEREKKRLLG